MPRFVRPLATSMLTVALALPFAASAASAAPLAGAQEAPTKASQGSQVAPPWMRERVGKVLDQKIQRMTEVANSLDAQCDPTGVIGQPDERTCLNVKANIDGLTKARSLLNRPMTMTGTYHLLIFSASFRPENYREVSDVSHHHDRVARRHMDLRVRLLAFQETVAQAGENGSDVAWIEAELAPIAELDEEVFGANLAIKRSKNAAYDRMVRGRMTPSQVKAILDPVRNSLAAMDKSVTEATILLDRLTTVPAS